MATPLYVRNLRPNAVLVKIGGLKYTVERRGFREDTVALPPEAREDPVVSTFLQRNILEEISKETFMTLATRPENTITVGPDKKQRREDVLPLVPRKAETEVNIPINNPEESRTPFLITDENIRDSGKLRSPRPEFKDSVPTTEEDIAAIEAARRAVEAAVSQVNLPEDETAQLKQQVNELTGLVRELLAKQEQNEAKPKAAPKPRKPRAPKKESTKANSA